MKSLLCILLFYHLFCNTCYAQNWNKIAREIKQEQKIQMTSLSRNPVHYSFFNAYNKCRRKILKSINVNLANDTIYILEKYGDGQDARIYSTIWNRASLISYSSDSMDSFLFVENNSINFPAYMMRLCSSWNINLLRKEGDLHPVLLPSAYNCLTRIIFMQKKHKISCIFFRDFFSFERDMKCDALYKLGQYNIYVQ